MKKVANHRSLYSRAGKCFSILFICLLSCLTLLTGCPVASELPPPNNPQSALAVPQNIRAAMDEPGNAIVITWDAVPNAGSYLIFREAGSSFVQLAETQLPVYYDTIIMQGIQYRYKVQARAAGIGNSAFSEMATGFIPCTSPMSTIMVLDSIGGTIVEKAMVDVMESGFLLCSQSTDNRGEISLPLVPGKTYSLTAHKEGRATARLQDITIKETGCCLTLYCHNLGMRGFSVIAPEVKSIAYSNDNQVYQPLAPGSTLSVYDFYYVSVTVKSWNIIPDAHSGSWGFVINLDSDTAQSDYIVPETLDNKKEADNSYLVTAVFDLSTYLFMNGKVRLYITAYDLVSNRVECIVPFSLSSAEIIHDPDLSGIIPKWGYFYAETFGNSLETTPTSRGFLPYEDTAVSWVVYLSYMVNDTQENPQQIRKVDFYRSTDDLSYTYIGSSNFRGLVGKSSYQFIDNDSLLEPGVKYYYKLAASNAAGSTQLSPAVALKLLPPFHVYLDTPGHNTVCPTTAPALVFTLSRVDLLNSEFIYGFEFSLEIMEMTGKIIFKKDFRWDAYDRQFKSYEDWLRVAYFTLSGNKIAFNLQTAGITLERGKTYAWNIRGIKNDYYGVKFYNYFFQDNEFTGFAFSHNTNYLYGGDAANGAYYFSIAHDAAD